MRLYRRFITFLIIAVVAATTASSATAASAPVQSEAAAEQSRGGQSKKKSAPKSSAKPKPKAKKKKNGQGTAAKKGQKQRTSGDVRREQQATTADIKETSTKLDANRRSTAEQLSRLTDLRSRIDEQNKVIAATRADAGAIEARIVSLSDTIAGMREHVEKLRKAYAATLKRFQGTEKATDKLSFIFAADSFNEAVARIRYMRRVARWRRARSEELQKALNLLHNRQSALELLLKSKTVHINRLNHARAEVERDSRETSRIVADLQREGSSLQAHLKQQQQRLASLDRELDRIIAAEQERQRREQQRQERLAREKEAREKAAREKAAREKTNKGKAPATGKDKPVKGPSAPPEREAAPIMAKATASAFASMKGRLPFPVEGKYRVISTFGRHPHPDIPNIEVQNSGIDIEMTGSSQRARAICDGTVSAVFHQPGYNNIVMIRHGEYITIYAGLDNLAVHTGESVRTGQTLGQVQRDPDNAGRRVLHFELRHERDKLNPLLWVR